MEALVAVSPLRTILFAILAIALGIYIYSVEMPKMASEAEPSRLLVINPERVEKVNLRYPSGLDIEVEKDEAHWNLVAPLAYPADDVIVDRLIKAAADLELERRLTPEETLSLNTYGLDASGTQARVQFTETGGAELPAIIVGDTTPVGFSAFAKLENSDEVVVTPLLFHSGMKKSVFDLRDKKLVPIDTKNVIALEIEDGDQSLRMERAGDAWRLRRPIEDSLDAGAIAGILDTFSKIEALEFYDGDEAVRAELGLDTPIMSVRVEVGDRVTGFNLSKTAEGSQPAYHFERLGDGQMAKVDARMMGIFQVDLGIVRDRAIFRCDFNTLTAVRFTRADGESFTLEREAEDAWSMEPPLGRSVNQHAAKRVLRGLGELTGERVMADNVDTEAKRTFYGLDTPVVEVALLSGGEDGCPTVAVGTPDPQAAEPIYYFQERGSGKILSAPGHTFSRVDINAESLLTPASQD